MDELFEVIAEDDDFLVVNKPAGLVCHPTKGDIYSSLISRARLYLKAAEPSHLINRLDRETSGIVVLAKSIQVAAQLRKQWEKREVDKEYLAIVHGHLERPFVRVSAPLAKDHESRVAIKDKVAPEGTSAETLVIRQKLFEREGKPFSLARLVPLTGRKHQLRIHLSHIGHPIVGDKIYGGDESLYLDFVVGKLTPEQSRRLLTEHHALHANLLSFDWFGARRTYACDPERWFLNFTKKPASNLLPNLLE
ncbi:MAG TPA: RluA family pseudouridine synthase [Verrucomicrobiae bacterium]|jgi:23S rRNA pseudouridine1911/1915/1917 synthase|nr:RluA family pseudouridine synthase [Verrucomicrobiae bacterium]